MKCPVSGVLSAAALASLLLFHGRAFAQSGETPAPASAAAPLLQKEEVIVLSPFKVNVEKDEGFVATSSLAGGRLNTALKDTPVAYSVLTRDFLDALTLLDQEQALTWSVGSYMPIVALSAYRYNDNEGGSSIMTRGQQTSGAQRNFFHLSLNTDTYNQERIDFARGPNALLFGTNGLGGVVNTLTKQAGFDRSFTKASVLVGSWDRYRATFDVNRVINEKLAARVNLLWQNAKTWRDLEFDNRRGVHLTTTYRPFKQNRTELRAEYEYYLQSTIMGRETMLETFSGWDGVTTVAAPGTQAIAGSDNKGVSRDGSLTAPFRVYVPGTDAGTVMNWANTWRTQGGAANANVPVGGQFALSTANLGINFGPMINSVYSYDLLYGNAESGSFFNRSLYSTRETVIQPHLPTLEYSYHVASLFLNHQQGDHLFFEAAGYHAQTQKHVETAASRMGQAVIDVNATLPNGQANPNFKQVYSEALASSFYYHNRINEARATMAVVFNDTKWGDYVGNVNGGFRQVINGLNADTSVMNRNPDIRRRSVDDNFTYRFYWNSPTQPLVYPDSVNYVDPIAGTTTNYPVSKITDLRSIGTLRASDTLYTYLQGSLNAKLFKKRLVLFAGARRDTVTARNYSAGNTNNTMADYPVDWDGHTLYWRPTGPSDYFNLKYMVKDAAGVPTTGLLVDAASRPRDAAFKPLPQYAGDRFRDDFSAPEVDINVTTLNYGGVLHLRPWVSAFANYAESFRPPSAGVTITGQSLPASNGEGWDAGIRFSLLRDGQGRERIHASFGKYGGRQFDGAFDNTGSTRKYATIVDANPIGDLSANGQNKRNLGQFSTITFDFSDARNYGYEVDIVANLTNNWRLTANAGFPHNLGINPRKDEWAYLAANEATLKQIVLDAGVLIDAGNTATVDTSIPVGTRSPDASAAATAWNQLVQFKATNNPQAVTYSDQPKFTSNLYTDYRFSRGPLKNLRVGGGVQYFDRTAIGNRGGDTIINPANPLTAIDDPTVDATTRVYRDAYYTVTGTIGYQFKLPNKLPVELNLRIGNLLGNDDLVYIGAGLRAPGGDIQRPDRVTVPTTFVYLQPRSYSLTATVSF